MLKLFFKFIYGFLLFMVLGSTYVVATEVQDVFYADFQDTYKCKVLIPEGKNKKPVMIFDLGEYFDLYKAKDAAQAKVLVERLMRRFESEDYVTVVLEEKYKRYFALKAAIKYFGQKEYVDAERVSLMSMSQSAFFALIALTEEFDLEAAVLVSLTPIEKTGYFSLPNFVRNVAKIKASVFLASGSLERVWASKVTQVVYDVLKENNKEVIYQRYVYNVKNFWGADAVFMTDVLQWLASFKPVVLEESKI